MMELILGALAATAAGAALTAALGWARLRRRWALPLRQLMHQGRQIAQASWRGQVSPAGAAEVRQVAVQFNRLATDTRRRLSKLEHEQADLYALVDTLPDAILVSDRQGRLILMNAPAARLLRLEAGQALEQKVVSVITDEAVVELFEAATAAAAPPSQPIQRELHLSRGGQKLTCQAVATRTVKGGTLVVLRDVSTLARAIQMKTDFVANASHELRTPITAIKIAFETLRETVGDDPQQAERCMAVIDGHLRRLEEMLRDLLDLSRVEGPENQPAITLVKIADLFNAIGGTLSPMARQKQVDLEFSVCGPPQFASDVRLLNLILKNLVENGVKYTPAGGKVMVRLQTPAAGSDGHAPAILTVSDTGIGIAPEHIDRVFERFYQVDSARSGSAGRGTGLGLAIVKHAVHALGGQVKLESAVGKGTTVICLLPQPPAPPLPASSPSATEDLDSSQAEADS